MATADADTTSMDITQAASVCDLTGDGVTRFIGEVHDPAHLHGVVAHVTSMNAELISIGPIDTAVAAPLPADLTLNNEQEWTFRS